MKGTLTTLILGAALAEYGLTGLQHDEVGCKQWSRKFQAASC